MAYKVGRGDDEEEESIYSSVQEVMELRRVARPSVRDIGIVLLYGPPETPLRSSRHVSGEGVLLVCCPLCFGLFRAHMVQNWIIVLPPHALLSHDDGWGMIPGISIFGGSPCAASRPTIRSVRVRDWWYRK